MLADPPPIAAPMSAPFLPLSAPPTPAPVAADPAIIKADFVFERCGARSTYCAVERRATGRDVSYATGRVWIPRACAPSQRATTCVLPLIRLCSITARCPGPHWTTTEG